jgi:hypothetical protein
MAVMADTHQPQSHLTGEPKPALHRAVAGPVATVTLTRPEQHDALDDAIASLPSIAPIAHKLFSITRVCRRR